MKRASYPSDLTDVEWGIIKAILEVVEPYRTGRPVETDYREIWNAIFYINRTGCQWRYLPHDFPPWTTVNYHYMKWLRNGVYGQVNDALRGRLRQEEGRNETPSAGLIDSQSVKGTVESGVEESGIDGGKLVKGRKRHIATDTNGYLLEVVSHAANTADSVGGREVLRRLFDRIHTIQLIWADGSYPGLVDWALEELGCIIEIVNKKKNSEGEDIKGFQVLPRRWVVERTFAWLNFYRRLVKDYERTVESSESFLYLANIRMVLSSIARIEEENF